MVKNKSLDKRNIEELLKEVEEKAGLMTKIKTNQVRNFYSKIIQIKEEFQRNDKKWSDKIETQIHLLKPALAYAAGRQKDVGKFKDYFDSIIDELISSEDKVKGLEKFFILIESFVAYHKFYGGDK